jgi:hypothetical protein
MEFFRPVPTFFQQVRSRVVNACHQADAFEHKMVARFGVQFVLFSLWTLFFVLQLAGYFAHEPWKDETQAWLMARDMTIPELWRNAGTEGHPIGWHLLAKPLTLLGLPFDALRLVNIALVLTAAAVVLRAAPFTIWQRAIVILTPPFVYFGMYARSYSLILLLCTLHAAAYASRHDRPVRYGALLGAIANTSVLFMPYVGLMGLWWLWETCRDRLRGDRVAGILLMGGLILLAVLQIVPPAEMAQVRTSNRWYIFFNSLGFTSVLRRSDFFIMPLFFIFPWVARLSGLDRALGWIALGSMMFFPFVNAFIYGLSPWHWFACFSIMLFVSWILKVRSGRLGWDRRAVSACLVLFFWLAGLTVYESARLLVIDTFTLASNTRDFLPYAREHLLDKDVAGHQILNVTPILAYIPDKKIWSPVSRKWTTYVVFTGHYVQNFTMEADKAAGIILDECPVRRPWMLFSKPWANATQAGYSLVHNANQTSIMKEDYYVYAPGPEEDSGGIRKQ